MKRILTTLLVAAIFGNLASAQARFGLRAGVNSVNAYVVAPDGTRPGTSAGTGFYAGGIMKIPFDNKLYFVPGIQYSYKNYTIHYNDADLTSCKMHLTYIEIPLLLNYDFKKSGNYFFVQAGPSFSVALSGKQDDITPGQASHTEELKFAYSSFGRYEANAVFNAGFHFKNNLSVIGGYALGLGTIVNDDNGPVIKHRMFSFGLGYLFN
jgi:hypothetical protein